MSVKHTNGGQAVCECACFSERTFLLIRACAVIRINAECQGKYQLVQFILHLLYYIARYLTLNYLIQG